MKAIINTKLVMEDGIIWDGALTFENGRIIQADWADKVEIPKDAEIIDAGGLYTAPGLIDIHNHGSEDHDFGVEPEAAIADYLKHGETTVLPTVYCDLTAQGYIEAGERIRAAARTPNGRAIHGMYMEGPYMSGYGSNQNSILWTGDIIKEEYEGFVQALKGFAKIWAIDPSRPGIEDFMKYVKQVDPEAIFAFGHSQGRFSDCKRVYPLGVRVQTHFNDSGQAKGFAQGTAGSGCDHFSLYNPDMYAELICDENGIHVDGDLIKTLIRTKGVERVILITDGSTKTGDFTNNEADGIAWGPDLNYDYEGHLAGSHVTLDNACRNIMKHTGYGLCHAIRMASLNPATLLGIEKEVGSIEAGKKANLIIIDDTVRVKKVFLEGDLVSENGELV